nr:hypothetical protein [Lentzea sp. NBRC 105346]
MVLAISFVEAPLKFRASGVTVQIGLGIGRIVFRALNIIEAVLAAALIMTAIVTRPPTTGWVIAVVALFVVQVGGVKTWLGRRSNAVLAGNGEGRRSRAHLAYVAMEVLKVAGLVTLGVLATP